MDSQLHNPPPGSCSDISLDFAVTLSLVRQALYKQLVDVMRGFGIEAVPTVGVAFDPEVHDAMMREHSDEVRAVLQGAGFLCVLLWQDDKRAAWCCLKLIFSGGEAFSNMRSHFSGLSQSTPLS